MAHTKRVPVPCTRYTVLVCAAALLFPYPLAAQLTTGTILGTITDRTGGVLPDVTVLIVNEATNVERNVTTDGEGSYEAPLLPPGDYRLEAERQGFRKAIRAGIRLQVNQRARIDLLLEIGAVDEEVVVRAEAPLAQTESAAVGTVVDRRRMVELPLNGRDFFQLATLVTGAVPPAQGSQNATQGGAVSVNGAREQSNNFLLDGLDNNDPAINQIVVPASIDAVEEFKVQSSTYSAEFGRSAGGQFSFVTRSGTNRWRFSGYESMRHAALDARNFFDDPQRAAPPYRRDQFGATAGGPLQRDRLFVFGHYEGTRVRQAFTRVATVPPLAWVNGDFSGLLTGTIDPGTGLDVGQLVDPRTGQPIPGNLITPALMDPAGAAIARFYPAPDDATARGPADATVSPRGRTNLNQFTLRVDQSPGAASHVFYRYSLSDEDRFNPFDPLVDPTNVPGFGSFTRNRGQSLVAGWNRAGGRTLNELRVGFNRLRAGIFQEHLGQDVSSALGIRGLSTNPGQAGRPGVVVGVTDDLIEPTNLPQDRRDTTLQVSNSLTLIRGRHSLKTGAEMRHVRVDSFLDVFARGQFTFVGLSGHPFADLLLGVPFVSLRQNPATQSNSDFRTTAVGAYVQDDWRITSNLTVNVGVRYEVVQPPYDRLDRLSLPDFDSDGDFIQAGTQGLPRGIYRIDWNNVAPRTGVAWRPFGDTRTVIRGGYGIFYDTTILNVTMFPRLSAPQFFLDLIVGPRPLQDAFDEDAVPASLIASIDPDYRDGFYQHFSAGVQREIRSSLLDFSYVGSRGHDLPMIVDTNQGPPGGPALRHPAFGPVRMIVPAASSRYDSLQVRVDRPFARHVSVSSGYTWSRCRDTGSSLFGAWASSGVPQNSFDVDADRGPCDVDTPHRLVFSSIWELPFGRGRRFLDRAGLLPAIVGEWQVAGIATLQSGRPFTVYYGASANYSGTSNGFNGGPGVDRPNQVGNPQPAAPTPARWFDPAAFAPPDGAFGTVGRNTLRGDAFRNVDLGFSRNVVRSADARVQLRVEVFNVLNRPYFFLPIADLTNANAGRVTQAGPPRQVQIGARVDF